MSATNSNAGAGDHSPTDSELEDTSSLLSDCGVLTPTQSTIGDSNTTESWSSPITPPSAYSETVAICHDYDLLLELGHAQTGAGMTWGVSSAALTLSSPVLKQYLTSQPTDPNVSRFIRNGVEVLRIKSVDFWVERHAVYSVVGDANSNYLAEMGNCLLLPIHFSNGLIPVNIDIEVLARVCAFTSQFELVPALKPWFTIWVQTLVIPDKLPDCVEPWLIVAIVLGDKVIYDVCKRHIWWNMSLNDLRHRSTASPLILQNFFESLSELVETDQVILLRFMYHVLHNYISEKQTTRHVLPPCTITCNDVCEDVRIASLLRAMTKYFGRIEYLQRIYRKHILQEGFCTQTESLKDTYIKIKAIGGTVVDSIQDYHAIIDCDCPKTSTRKASTHNLSCHEASAMEFERYFNVTWMETCTTKLPIELVANTAVACLNITSKPSSHWMKWQNPTMKISLRPNGKGKLHGTKPEKPQPVMKDHATQTKWVPVPFLTALGNFWCSLSMDTQQGVLFATFGVLFVIYLLGSLIGLRQSKF